MMMTMLGWSASVAASFYSDRFMSETADSCSWIIDAEKRDWKDYRSGLDVEYNSQEERRELCI